MCLLNVSMSVRRTFGTRMASIAGKPYVLCLFFLQSSFLFLLNIKASNYL